MGNEKRFDALIVVTADDCKRLQPLYPRLIENYPYGKLCFIGPADVGAIIASDSRINNNSFAVDENSLIPFNEVHKCMAERLADILKGREMPRAVTGWYYQQFLKMQYCAVCQDEYYMVWDGDTIPCREINMFQAETDKPYLDLKHEFHPEYFDTISKLLPGFRKVIERSFISEHMLIKKEIMRHLIEDIEKNDRITGKYFWEKIINSIPPEKISDSSFSEFETYGTYVAMCFPDVYKLRDWHSFRLGAQFFGIDTITDRDFKWLSKDFDAISFEKNQAMFGDGNTFFNDPAYQEKLSAKQMLQAVQMEFNGGYKEVWADDPVIMKNANVTKGGFANGKGMDNRTLFVIVDNGNEQMVEFSIEGIKSTLSELNYKYVVTDSNLPFYKAVNKAIRDLDETQYKDWDICVLKSGTRVVFDSVHFLKQALYSSEDIGAAGSVSNLAGNKQQIDIKFDTPQEYIEFGEKNNVLMEDPYLERVTLSSNAILIKREAFEKVGGFAEEFGDDGIAGDADFSLRLLACGYRLRLVRNSFVYRKVWDERENQNNPEQEGLLSLIYAKPDIFSQINFGKKERFNALEIGCGLGANIKALKSLYPNAQAAGVEKNAEVADIAVQTELVYKNLSDLEKNIGGPAFNLLIVNKDDFAALSQDEKKIIGRLCCSDFQVITK
jgi:GT2 family glycosyltransferase